MIAVFCIGITSTYANQTVRVGNIAVTAEALLVGNDPVVRATLTAPGISTVIVYVAWEDPRGETQRQRIVINFRQGATFANANVQHLRGARNLRLTSIHDAW